MDRERFELLVKKAIEDLPEEFLSMLQNIDVVVEDSPTATQLDESGIRRSRTLLGLYEGVPLTNRGRGYGLVPPDKITIFRKPIESISRNDTEIIAQVQRVVRHEIAHHFGSSDSSLRRIERHQG